MATTWFGPTSPTGSGGLTPEVLTGAVEADDRRGDQRRAVGGLQGRVGVLRAERAFQAGGALGDLEGLARPVARAGRSSRRGGETSNLTAVLTPRIDRPQACTSGPCAAGAAATGITKDAIMDRTTISTSVGGRTRRCMLYLLTAMVRNKLNAGRWCAQTRPVGVDARGAFWLELRVASGANLWTLRKNEQEYGYCTGKRWSVNLADWGLAVVHIFVIPTLVRKREPIWRFAQARRMDAPRT